MENWTDVKKFVPNNNRDVLVVTIENGNVFYHVAQYWKGEWVTHSEQLHYVTNWMELPPFTVRLEKLFIKTDLTDEPSNEEQN